MSHLGPPFRELTLLPRTVVRRSAVFRTLHLNRTRLPSFVLNLLSTLFVNAGYLLQFFILDIRRTAYNLFISRSWETSREFEGQLWDDFDRIYKSPMESYVRYLHTSSNLLHTRGVLTTTGTDETPRCRSTSGTCYPTCVEDGDEPTKHG